jgi:photosystem II stability/assembly factor-like uncharacterized protein
MLIHTNHEETPMESTLKSVIVVVGVLVLAASSVRAQWVPVSTLTEMKDGCIAVNGDTVFVGTMSNGVYLSTDNCASWTAVDSGLPSGLNVSCLAMRGGNVFAGTNYGNGIFLSSNNGKSWSALSTGLFSIPNNYYVFILSLAVAGGNVIAGTGGGGPLGGGVYLLANSGASWTAVDSGLPPNTPVSAIAVSGNNLFAGICGGVTAGVYRSSDSGKSWSAVDSGLTDPRVTSLATIGNSVFAGTMDGSVYLSKDNGTRWIAADSGLPSPYLYVSCFGVSESNIFAGTYYDGVFLSTNNGTSWTAVDSGLSSKDYSEFVTSLALSDSYVFAGTGEGIFRRPLSDILPVKNPQNNYLFFQSTLMISTSDRFDHYVNISFSLPKTEQVQVNVYDMSGCKIASLVNEHLESGPHSLTWNTRNVAAGYYIAKMQAGATTLVKSVPLFR